MAAVLSGSFQRLNLWDMSFFWYRSFSRWRRDLRNGDFGERDDAFIVPFFVWVWSTVSSLFGVLARSLLLASNNKLTLFEKDVSLIVVSLLPLVCPSVNWTNFTALPRVPSLRLLLASLRSCAVLRSGQPNWNPNKQLLNGEHSCWCALPCNHSVEFQFAALFICLFGFCFQKSFC